MNSRTTRVLKEARALFWPWCAVTIAALWPLHAGWTEWIGPMGFFCGILLLATLSLGNEFQHRTLSLLLSQPISRMRIWGEKLSVTVVAVLSAALVFCYSWRSALEQDPLLWVVGGVYVITTMASATFWTLLTRSTLGGAALNIFSGSFVWIFIGVRENWKEILGSNPSPARTITALWTVALVALCGSGVMLWLGARKLVRFQVTGGMAGDDLLMAGPSVMPETLAGLFRCRPTGAFLNLIRKELRLLRPLWLFTLLAVLFWTWLTIRLIPGRESTTILPGLDAGVLFAVSTALGAGQGKIIAADILIAILAGILSLGEERTSGTHSWHMTLPVPARRQWLIKLVMAMFAGFVCAVLLPTLVVTVVGFIFGSPFMFVDPRSEMVWLPAVLLLSFASFWCACAVSGTVRAALWVVPAMGAVFLASRCGDWVAGKLAQTTGTLVDLVVSWFRISPFNDFPYGTKITWVLVPTFLFAVIQSYRLFRRQPEDGLRSMIRCLLPVAIVAFLCSFALGASGFGFQPRRWDPSFETYLAIEKLQPGVTKLDAAHPLRLTVEDLAKVSPLSALTRRWLRNSNITFSPDQAHSGYFATIHLAGGLDCRLAVRHYGGRSSYSERPSCVRRSP